MSIGVHDHEKTAPQRLLFSIEADLSSQTSADDDLDATLDYDQICDFVRGLARQPHILLQETIARRVLEFTLSFPGVEAAEVEVCKPDIFDDCEFVGVRLSGRRS